MNTPNLSLLPPGGKPHRESQRLAPADDSQRFRDQLQSEVSRSRGENSPLVAREASSEDVATVERQEQGQRLADDSQGELRARRDASIEQEGATETPEGPVEGETESVVVVDQVLLSVEEPIADVVLPPETEHEKAEFESDIAVALPIPPLPVDAATLAQSRDPETEVEPDIDQIAAAAKTPSEPRAGEQTTQESAPSAAMADTRKKLQQEASVRQSTLPTQTPAPPALPANTAAAAKKPQDQPEEHGPDLASELAESAGIAPPEPDTEASSPALPETKSDEQASPKPSTDQRSLLNERASANETPNPPPVSPLRSQASSHVGSRNVNSAQDEHPQVDPARFVSRVARAFVAAGERGGQSSCGSVPPNLARCVSS
jgi:flagellar hook-length control protein FliK